MDSRGLEFQVLGPLAVVRDGTEIPLGGFRQQLVLAVLLLNAGRVVPAERLVDAIWGEAGPATGTGPLRNHIWQLRRLLRPNIVGEAVTTHAEGQSPLVSRPGGYRLDTGDSSLDSHRFEQALAEVSSAGPDQPGHALRCLDDALALWRGPAFGDPASESAVRPEATRLDQLRLSAQEHRAELLLAIGDHNRVATELEALARANPERERLWALLMTALYRAGRQSDALGCFQEARVRLVDHMGIEPGAELRALEQSILHQDPTLDWQGLQSELVSAPDPRPHDELPRPARPVTFLFTDVEQSTILWDRDPHAMAAALAAHDAVLHEAIDGHRGQVFGRSGDGFCAAFDRAADAVAAATVAQISVQDCEQTRQAQLRIRVAIHTGDAEMRERTYFGPSVNRAARMRDAGHGGQVLVSATTRELVSNALPDEAELVDIGTWLFEGLSRPERVYQLKHPALADGFPPLRSARPRTASIPRNSTSFVGRQAEITATNDALRTSQLVTLTGEGGIGKTRLALEVVQRVDPAEYPDGVWFCDVSSVEDLDGLAEEVAAALGLPATVGTDVRGELVAHLRAARLLLLIDNSERLRSAIAELVAEILASGAEAKILATSRAPLRTSGEQIIHLDPLAVPEATTPAEVVAPSVTLLVDRARAAGAPVVDDDPALGDIARFLDGVPLAIELAAPRLTTMSPSDLAKRLDRRFDLLTGATAAPARQRTLRATLDWSFDLLSQDAQRLFGALSVFRGGWTLDAAEAIGGAIGLTPDAVAPLVAELVDQSMIRVDMPPRGTARYRMLETMLAYAAERLAENPEQRMVVSELHAHYFIQFAETAARYRHGPLEPGWVAAIDAEFDNLRAAYRWTFDGTRPGDALRLVAALTEDNIMRERQEVGRWAEELAKWPPAQDEPLLNVALGLAAHTAAVEFRTGDALRLARDAVAHEQRTKAAPSWIPRTVLALLTGLAFAEGDERTYLREMDEISRVTGDPFAAAVADFDRALIATLVGKPERGRRAADRLLAVGAERENPTILAMGLLSRGRVTASSQPRSAALDFDEALRVASDGRNACLVQLATRTIQELKASMGDSATALRSLRDIAKGFERKGNVSEQMQTVLSMLDPLVALEAYVPMATICGALSQTPWRLTAAAGLMELAASEALGRQAYLAARRAGAAMSASELIAYVSAFIRELPDQD